MTQAKQRTRETPAFTGAGMEGIIGLIVLAVLNIVFWMVYEQGGNTHAAFRGPQCGLARPGAELIPSTWYQSMNPLFIFMLTPSAERIVGLAGAGASTEPSSVTKMAMGCAFLGLSFLPLIFITRGWRIQRASVSCGWWATS